MTSETHAPAALPVATRRRSSRLYLAVWCVLGTAAAGYLGLLATGDRMLGSLKWSAQTRNTNVAQKTTVVLRRTPENEDRWKDVHGELVAMRSEIANIDVEISLMKQRDQKISARLDVIDATVNRQENPADAQAITSVKAPVSEQTSDSASGTRKVASAIEGTTLDGVTRTPEPVTETFSGRVNVTGLVSAGDTLAVANAVKSPALVAPIVIKAVPKHQPANRTVARAGTQQEVAAVDAAAAQPVPQRTIPANVPLPGRRKFGVELATGRSVDSLRLSWALLNERHRELLGSLAPRYVQSSVANAAPYRLIAGPFDTKRPAKELCIQLQAYYVSCKTATFSGELL